MTKQKKHKERVRARAKKTGKSYQATLQQRCAQAPRMQKDKLPNASNFYIPMTADGKACLECGAGGRVDREGSWVGEEHSDNCPVGLGEDYGEGYGALRELEGSIYEILELIPDSWSVLDDGLEHPTPEVNRLVGLIKGPRQELEQLRMELDVCPISWRKEKSTSKDKKSRQRRYRNQVLEHLGYLYCELEDVASLVESAWERLDDKKRHTNDEHRALNLRLSGFLEIVARVSTVVCSPALQWNPSHCPTCGCYINPLDGGCQNCDYIDKRLHRRFIRSIEADCPRCSGLIRAVSEWKCREECGYVDKERLRSMERKERSVLAGLRGDVHRSSVEASRLEPASRSP